MTSRSESIKIHSEVTARSFSFYFLPFTPITHHLLSNTYHPTIKVIMMKIKTVGLASDHAGFALKEIVKQYLDEKGIPYKDYGTNSEESTDYSDYGHTLAQAVENGEVYPAIGMCGSGEGINMTLNKHQGIRAALVWAPEIAHLARRHNDANVLVMPGRFIDKDTARSIMDEFFATDFEGGRHQRRIDKIPLQSEK